MSELTDKLRAAGEANKGTDLGSLLQWAALHIDEQAEALLHPPTQFGQRLPLSVRAALVLLALGLLGARFALHALPLTRSKVRRPPRPSMPVSSTISVSLSMAGSGGTANPSTAAPQGSSGCARNW